MRLLHLNRSGRLILTDFRGGITPPYAILSHRWEHLDSEVLFSDLGSSAYQEKDGYRKIEFCAKQATQDQLQYFWIDTCCIDRWNFRELSSSINSMFDWYKNAARCYVFLSDVSVTTASDTSQRSDWETSFRASTWFTRGWTLQELIAPQLVEFFSCEGQRIGDKTSLGQLVHEITSIPLAALEGFRLNQFTISERVRWAVDRKTTQEEDTVYCLLGVLGVSMPISYGEGRKKALRRLQAEVEVASSTPSIIPSSQSDHFAIGLDANHANMVKFASKLELEYQQLSNTLNSIVGGIDNHGARLETDGEDNSSFRDSAYGTLSETASIQGMVNLPGVREEMLDILINDKSLKRSGHNVVQDLDADTFVDMFKTLLQTFAWELRREAGAKEQKRAANAFWWNAAYAAKCVYEYWSGVEGSKMSKLLAQLPERKIQLDHVIQQIAHRTTSEHASDYDAGNGNEWEDHEPEGPVHLKRLEDFITTSSAFQNLRESLQNWARSSTSTKGMNIDYDIVFTKTLISNAQDFCKKAVERAAGTRLSWWPLAEPEKELRPNYTRIYSQPRIGSGRVNRCFYDDIPASLAEKLFPSYTIMRSATLNWRWRWCSNAVNPAAVVLRGTTLMRVLCEASEQRLHSVSSDRSKRQKSTATSVLNRRSVHKDGSKADSHITKRGDRTTASSSKSQGKQPTTVNDGHGKETIPTVEKPEATRPRRDDGQEPKEDRGAPSPGIILKKESSNGPIPVLFLSVDIVTNDSRACSVDVGTKDLDTMENLRKSYNALRSTHFWNRKRPTGVKFYRFKSFIYKGKRHHHVYIHKDMERYPAKDDRNYEWKLEDEDGDTYPNGEAWYFFNYPEDCGTSTALKEMLPKKFKDEERSRAIVYGMYIEERQSVWQIFVPAVLFLGLTLVGTLWFIPLWLKEHPGDLQNATVPVLLTFTVVQFILTLLTSLIIFRWSL